LNGPLQNLIIVHPVYITAVLSIFQVKLIEGVFSGNIYVDSEGTWNGTTFTITVIDTEPHFFYWISFRYFQAICSVYGNWSNNYGLSSNEDVLFAINPVCSCWI
jgi:hypothetical protein